MKRCFFLLMLFCCLRVTAQVSMSVQLPPSGVLLKAQLWNMVLISAKNGAVNVRLTMRLIDAATNQPVLTGITRSIVLTKGARRLQASDFMPVQYEYISPVVDRDVNGFLPAGNYLACYSLIVEGDKSGYQPGEDCIPFAIEPVSPPMLNSPADQSKLLTFLPQFSWLPPAPLTMFSDLNYEMILTEVHNNQSPEEAIQRNIPVLRVPGLRGLFLNYPSGAKKLDTSTTYAWSIVARNGNLFAAQTEAWVFRVTGTNNNTSNLDGAYIKLRKELDGAVVRCGEEVQISYNNEAGDTSAQYELLLLGNTYRPVFKGKVPLRWGNNHLKIPLGRSNDMQTGQIYLFRLLNSRNEFWQMKFICTKEE